MPTLSPITPVRADHRFIMKVVNMVLSGKGQATDVGHFEMAVREVFHDEASKKNVASATAGPSMSTDAAGGAAASAHTADGT